MQDNDERAIFFCKGVIETVKKLGWAPDIVHCNDWITSLIPYVLKDHLQKRSNIPKCKMRISQYTIMDLITSLIKV